MARAAAAVVGGALVVRGLRRRSLAGAATALAGGALLARALGVDNRMGDALSARTDAGRRRGGRVEAGGATEVSRSVTVGKSADEVYEAWRNPERFSRVMGHFADVAATDDDRLRWTVHGPGGRDVSWETHVTRDEPGEELRWESPPDAMLPNEGAVSFRPAPGDRGTVVTLALRFDPPGGSLTSGALRRLDIIPETLAGEALGRFKSLVETGEIPTTEGNPSGRGKGDLL